MITPAELLQLRREGELIMRRAAIFEKVFQVIDSGKTSPNFWEWVQREIDKTSNPYERREEWKAALRKCVKRHADDPRGFSAQKDCEFNNLVPDEEVERILALVP